MAKLVRDLGGINAKVYFKSYRGNLHIIIKGYPGLRKILTGTKYGINNPKVVSMGLGKVGAVNAAKQGGLITVVLLTSFRVIDYFLTDRATLGRLVGTLATDIVKIGIATGASIAVAGMFGAATMAVGPIMVVIGIGFLSSAALESADTRLKITKRIIAGLDELGDDVQGYISQKQQQIETSASETVDSVIDEAIESVKHIAVKWVRKQLRQYLSSIPMPSL